MKRLMLFAAVALAFSTGAIAQNGTVKSTATKLSDAQLDQVTAGAVVRILYNPGKHVVQQDSAKGFFGSNCINCTNNAELVRMGGALGTGGLIVKTTADGVPVSLKAIGGWRSLLD